MLGIPIHGHTLSLLVASPRYSRSAEEGLFKGHLAPGAGHWLPVAL